MRIAIALLFILVLSLQVSASTIRVPQDQPTIQAGISAAFDDDTVLVAKGQYGGNWSIVSKSIFIIAADTMFQQTLVGSGGIVVEGCESASIEGFYFYYDEPEVGIPVIDVRGDSKCTIRRSVFYAFGVSSPMHCDSTSTLLVRQCVFHSPFAEECTIDIEGRNSAVINCTFFGGYNAICASGDSALIMNNAILNYTNGGIIGADSQSEVDYNLFWNNSLNYVNSNQGLHDVVSDPVFDCLRVIDWFCDLPVFPPRWSPTRNSGSPLPEFVDPDGTRNDIGAYFRPSQVFIPDDYPSLSEAIRWAVDGDSIVYRIGVHPESSFVDTYDLRDVWIVGEGEDRGSILEPAEAGKSILKFNPTVRFNESDPIESKWHVANLVFRNSTAAPALWIQNNNYQGFDVHNCQFENNTADSGAGLYVIVDEEASCSIDDNDFIMNGGGFGTALLLDYYYQTGWGNTSLDVCHNNFIDNTGISIFETSTIGIGSPALNVCSNLFQTNIADSCISNSDTEWSYWTGNRWLKNVVLHGGYVHNLKYARTRNLFEGNSLILNSFPNEPGIAVSARGRYLDFKRNLIALTENGSGAVVPDTTGGALHINVACNNSWGNDLAGYSYMKLDSTNISENPLLCDTSSASLQLYNISPCLPDFNQCGVKIGAESIGCLGPPVVLSLSLQGESPNNVISGSPSICWRYHDLSDFAQSSFEIAVGSDSDWTYAELWNPAPFALTDTFVVYNGASLTNGVTYWLRLRVSNGLSWSDWLELMFRMNSIPSTPLQRAPLPGTNVTTSQPSLIVRNSLDAEDDSLYYILEVSQDSTLLSAHQFTKKQDSDSLTSATIDIVLNENTQYFWRVRASDYYEESAWSTISSFWVNAANSAPLVFDLLSPADGISPPIATRTPTLAWSAATDVDPSDVVTYSLHLALDSNFSFVDVTSGIPTESYQIDEPLNWSTKSWWKVKAIDQHGGETWSSQTFRFRTMTLGDADGSDAVTIADLVFLVNYIFAGGPAPSPIESGDPNCDGRYNITDLVYLINFIFASGAPPCEL